MNYTVRATTTDRDREVFHVTAGNPSDAMESAYRHLYRAGWNTGDLNRAVIGVKAIETDHEYAQRLIREHRGSVVGEDK